MGHSMTRRGLVHLGVAAPALMARSRLVESAPDVPRPPAAVRKLYARTRADLADHLTRALPGDHIILAGDTEITGEPIDIAVSGVVLRGTPILRQRLRVALRLLPGTYGNWIWGLRFEDVWNPFNVAGDDHVIGRCRIVRPGGITISAGQCNRLRVFACEFLGQAPWTAEERALGAAGGQPKRMHVRYQRDYPRDLHLSRCLFRGGLRRPIPTSFNSGQPDFLEPGGSGNLGNTATRSTFEHVLLDDHPGYDLLVEGGALFDCKTSYLRARHVTIKNTRGRIDIRNGQHCRLEGIWFDDRSDGTNIHSGYNIVNGWRGGANAVLRLLSGDQEWNVSNSGHAYAYRCKLHHVQGDILLGYRDLPLPPVENRIYAHERGSISVIKEQGTQVFTSSPLAEVVPRELTDDDVGCRWGL
ncbi:MAG: hypothetical protein U1E52_18795 [Geminicoccaceae bacterium]